MPEAEARGGMASDVLSGSGLGLLLGSVVGLTTTPVVAGVVGGITSLLAVFLGLDGGGEGKLGALGRVQLNGVRIGCFGLAAVVGVALGLYVRINNPLAEAPERQLERWQAAFPDNPRLAREMMVYERTRLKPAALSFDTSGPATEVTVGEGAGATAAVLYSALKSADNCRELAPARSGNDVNKLLEAYNNRGGPLAVVATQVRALPPEQRAGALESVRTLLCELEKPEQ
jgi:hypothetical protein